MNKKGAIDIPLAIVWAICLIVIAFLIAHADCPKNSVNYEGVCAEMPEPLEQNAPESKSWVSDEKPPRNPQPEWQRNDVHNVDVKSQDTVDDEIKAAQQYDASQAGKGKNP